MISFNFLDMLSKKLRGHHRYDMILGCESFPEPNIYLYFPNKTIRGNGGAYEGFNTSMKEVSEINLNSSSDWIKYKTFWNK